MPARRPERLYGIARQALDVVAAGLGASAPERQYVSDGPLVAWDCEQVVVAVERTSSTRGDVTLDEVVPIDCLTMRAATLLVYVVRCVPTMDDHGDPPSAVAIDTSAAVVLMDPELVVAALLDAYKAGTMLGCHGMAFLDWQGIGPEGGFSGGVLRVRVDLTAV